MKPTSLLLIALLFCAAAPAGANTYVVDQGGAGDFTTIQPALDACYMDYASDTILVHPGDYAEHLVFREAYAPDDLMLCTAGAASTSFLGYVLEGHRMNLTVRGMTVKEPCAFGGSKPLRWEGCAFGSSVYGGLAAVHSNVLDCDFYGPVTLDGYAGTLRSLRFHHAPLTMQVNGGSDVSFTDCIFDGVGADTLVKARLSNNLDFTHCQFSNGDVGVYSPFAQTWGVFISDCRFTRLGIGLLAPHLRPQTTGGAGVFIDSTRFEEGGRPVAVRFDSSSAYTDGFLELQNSQVVGCTDGGVVVAEDVGAGCRSLVRLTNIRFEQCGGAAVSAVVKTAEIRNCAFFANEGAGIDLTLTSSATTNLIDHNTFALNLGDGLSITAGAGSLPPGLAVARNVSAQNGGAGFRYASAAAGTFANNDAWQNNGGGYVGVAPGVSNFALDPRFCDLLNGDLTVSIGSPCAPNMPTGPIGAYGVGCDQELLAAPPSVAALSAFAVRPSPARGSVEFALPAGATGARVEVLDAQGRRVWSADVAPGARAVRWQGELDRGGAAGAGFYWARLTGAGNIQSKRFVWLK